MSQSQNRKRREIAQHEPGFDETIGTAAEEILSGLLLAPRAIPSKYFYDARGSQLFERITTLDEYYPSRTEKSILRTQADTILGGGGFEAIVELGSGDCSKISILFQSAVGRGRRLRYIPVDVSQAAIDASCDILASRFPGIETSPLVGDFLEAMDRLDSDGPRLICFFGSTIGNLTRDDADAFVARIGAAMNPGERFLLGLDMVKDRVILERAYNDDSGVTEAFNKNILRVANNLAGTNFEPDRFAHRAFFDEEHARVEMQLVATEDMWITSPFLAEPLLIEQEEPIHTEYSHKFTQAHVDGFARKGGFVIRGVYSDPRGYFSLVDFEKPGSARQGPP